MIVKGVKATAKQLNYGEEAILNTIKNCMPNDMYGAIFDINDLSKLLEEGAEVDHLSPATINGNRRNGSTGYNHRG